MVITLINDCADTNALGRLATRASSLLKSPTVSVGVEEYAELAIAGNMIDILDAYEDRNGIILANAAPRHGHGKKWPNGTPFGFFTHNNVLVVTTIDGLTLSLVKKLELVDTISVTDIPTVMEYALRHNMLNAETAERIERSQFRSFDYAPRLANWLQEEKEIPCEEINIHEVASAPRAVWHVDNFGNCKTTLVAEDVNFSVGETIETKFGTCTCYDRLKDVPEGQTALIIGSSGIGSVRFLELVVQGVSAAAKFNISVGSELD